MKILILSDIHGNIEALNEVFNSVNNIDMIFWLGDYITDVPMSHEVLSFIKEKLKQYKSYIIKGNREEYIIHYDNTKDENWSLENNTANLLLTYNSLTKEDLEFIKSLKEKEELTLFGYKILLTHKLLEDDNYDIIFFGHNHIGEYKNVKNTKYINPGSVGLSSDFDNRISYIIFEIDEEKLNISFYKKTYNYLKTIEIIKNSKLMDLKIKWANVLMKEIEMGIPYTTYYVNKAKELVSNKENVVDIWEEAYQKLDIF